MSAARASAIPPPGGGGGSIPETVVTAKWEAIDSYIVSDDPWNGCKTDWTQHAAREGWDTVEFNKPDEDWAPAAKSATLLVSDAAMAEVRNGMNKPWQNLNDIKVPKLIVRAQPISHIIISTLANAAKGRMEYFSLRNPEGILPKVIPAKTIETDSEE